MRWRMFDLGVFGAILAGNPADSNGLLTSSLSIRRLRPQITPKITLSLRGLKLVGVLSPKPSTRLTATVTTLRPKLTANAPQRRNG